MLNEILLKRQWALLQSLPAMIPIAWFHMSTNFSIAHYQSDLTHLLGNLLHHSSLKLDSKYYFFFLFHFVNAINIFFPCSKVYHKAPPGVLYLHFLNCCTLCAVMHYILQRFKINEKIYYALYWFFFPIRHKLFNEGVHVYIHTQKESYFPWPLSQIAKVDFESHVSGHHVTGLGFGDYPGFGDVCINICYFIVLDLIHFFPRSGIGHDFPLPFNDFQGRTDKVQKCWLLYLQYCFRLLRHVLCRPVYVLCCVRDYEVAAD